MPGGFCPGKGKFESRGNIKDMLSYCYLAVKKKISLHFVTIQFRYVSEHFHFPTTLFPRHSSLVASDPMLFRTFLFLSASALFLSFPLPFHTFPLRFFILLFYSAATPLPSQLFRLTAFLRNSYSFPNSSMSKLLNSIPPQDCSSLFHLMSSLYNSFSLPLLVFLLSSDTTHRSTFPLLVFSPLLLTSPLPCYSLQFLFCSSRHFRFVSSLHNSVATLNSSVPPLF